jgi:alkylation response protein AidB-like acyl-CoA dehydrogenase
MDFLDTRTYTEEQEAFRREVRAWLEENARVPEGMVLPREAGDITPEAEAWGLEYRRKLGAKGWYSPTWPKEYGGGGLPAELAVVLNEERAKFPVPYVYSNDAGLPPIMVWGTEEQKQKFLPPALRGEVILWEALSEPEVGSDAASIKTRATRDGDFYVVNGTKAFIGGPTKPDFIWTTTVTDPDRPRHENMGAFYIPADLPGVSWSRMDLIVNVAKNLIYFDNVRVPAEYLVGGENQGWRVTQTTLEMAHGAGGNIGGGRAAFVQRLIEYAKTTERDGQLIGGDPETQDLLMQTYISGEVLRLLGLRNFWMARNRQRMTFHGSQSFLMGKWHSMGLGNVALKVLGPYAMLDDEKWAPFGGMFEEQQRQAIVAHHPGGSSEIQKLIMARRLGLSRTREEAAPTHLTATR